MLSAEALNQITSAAIVAHGRGLDTNTPAIVLPDNYQVRDLEALHENRSRFRGTLNTASLMDFCDYVSNVPDADAYGNKGYIDADAMACTMFFNLGSPACPGHADHRATLKLKPTAAYSAMQQIVGKRLNQQTLAEWMEDWHEHLTVHDNSTNAMSVAAAVQKVRNITIKASAERTSSESNFGNQRSAMDSIEAANADQQPATLMFHARPFEDLDEHRFMLRLSILTGEDKPVLTLRWVQEEAQREAIAQEFKLKLKDELAIVADLTLGTFTPGQ